MTSHTTRTNSAWWRRLLGADEGPVRVSEVPERIYERLSIYFSRTARRQGLWRLLRAMWRHNAGRTSNAMAFDLFLAFVPMLALAGWALAQVVASREDTLAASSLLLEMTPNQLHHLIVAHFDALSGLQLAPVAAIAGWWLTSSAFYTMICVFEESFDCNPRPWWQGRLLSMGYALVGMGIFTLAGVLGVASTAKGEGVVGTLLHSLERSGLTHAAVVLLGILVTTTFLAAFYRSAIRRPGYKRRMWQGAAVATVLGAAGSAVFGYYAARVSRFALFYGSLAAVAMLLIWLWLWCTAILLGAELNVLLEDSQAEKEGLRPPPSV